MSYVLTFFAGMVFSAIAILASMVDDNSDELWCGCDGEGMAHTLGAKGFACAAPSSAAPQAAREKLLEKLVEAVGRADLDGWGIKVCREITEHYAALRELDERSKS